MLPTKGYAALTANSPLVPYQFERRDPGQNDVLIQILYCGICHSDIHSVDNFFPNSLFPMVPGHEIVGRVTKIGSSVTKFKVGDTVGVGCYIDSCRVCNGCQQGNEHFCPGLIYTYNHVERDGKTRTYGGYSNQMVVDENYLLRVSPTLSLAGAAPLLCAGITTYSPLRHWNVGKGSKVGVLGLGGLGHLGVKFAAAMGAEVTVLSTSEKKRADAIRLGASNYVVTTDPNVFQGIAESLDIILNTVGADVDHNLYISLLKSDGVYVQLGLPESNLDINPFPLIMRRKSVAGSMFGGIMETQEMLDFCAEHNIVSDIEIIPIDKVNEAYKRVLKSDVRYRFVIDMSSLG